MDTVPGNVGLARAAAATVGLGWVLRELHAATVKVICVSGLCAALGMIGTEVSSTVLVTRTVNVVVSIA